MASTYIVADAIKFTQAICVGVPVAEIQLSAADMVNSIIWKSYPWSWAVKDMDPILMVDGVQDYGFAPTDYMRMVAARLAMTSATPVVYDELGLVRNLAPDLSKNGFRAGLTQIAYSFKYSGNLRLTSASAVPTGQIVQIEGEYQFQPTKITVTSQAFPFPDQHFNVYCEGLLWAFYRLAKDSREGTASANGKGGVMYTGQMGVFFDALMAMRESEDWGAGDNTFPSDPLGAGGFTYSNIYGPY